MSKAEEFIYRQEEKAMEIMLFFHQMLTSEYVLTDKITFGNPCYYRKSWICYLNPLKNGNVELAFLRGNELSNVQGILEDKGRKQVRSLEIDNLKKIPLSQIKEIIQEALILDDTIPYESKRNSRKK